MDVDPLADTVPPRHAIESDEEEDEYHPLRSSSSEQNQIVDVKIVGNLLHGRNLVVATGVVAEFWARGANLGEQCGGVYVNNIQVGLIFNPEWTQAIIIVSEVQTRLPIWAMHQYASVILDSVKPARVSLLDTYPIPSYITESPLPIQDMPLCYLATSIVPPAIKSKFEPFLPPNLIQTTSASFLSVLAGRLSASHGVLILVPSPHIPRPFPKTLSPSNLLQLVGDRFEWPGSTINTAQQGIFLFVDEQLPPQWVHGQGKASIPMSKRNEVGEGWMYI